MKPEAGEGEPLGEVIAAFPVGSWERGDGVIRGSVRDAQGTPLTDVEVRAVIWGTTPGVDQPAPHEVSLVQYIATEIEQYHYDHAMITSVRTDANGEFEIPELRIDAQYHLHVIAPGWYAWSSNKDRLSPGETCDLIAYRTAPVELRVRRADGSPVLTGRIWVGDLDGRRLNPYAFVGAWSHDHPTVDLPTEFSMLSFVSGEGERSGFVAAQFVAGTESTFEVELPVRSQIHCTVDAAPGVSRDGWLVGLQSINQASDPLEAYSYRRYSLDGRPSRWLTVGEPGPTRVALMFDDQVVEHVEVDATAGVSPVSFTIPAPVRSRGIQVRAVDAKGDPIAGCHFDLGVMRPPGLWLEHQTTQTPDGAYWIWLSGAYQPEREFHAEQVQITCHSPRHGTRQVTVDLVDAPTVDVVFDDPAWLLVDTREVRDPALLNRLYLSLAREEEGHLGSAGEGSVVGGKTQVRLGPVSPGSYLLQASRRADDWNRVTVGQTPITLVAGEQSSVLQVPALHELIVHVPADGEITEQETVVALSRVFDRDATSVRDWSFLGHESRPVVDGVAVFSHLAEGDYDLRFGQESMRIMVRGDQRINFAPLVYDCAEVTVSDASGPLAGWGFRSGDKIIAVDGRPVDPPRFRMLRFAFGVPGHRPVTVLRGGQTLDITVTVGDEPNWDLGGDFEPAQR